MNNLKNERKNKPKTIRSAIIIKNMLNHIFNGSQANKTSTMQNFNNSFRYKKKHKQFVAIAVLLINS